MPICLPSISNVKEAFVGCLLRTIYWSFQFFFESHWSLYLILIILEKTSWRGCLMNTCLILFVLWWFVKVAQNIYSKIAFLRPPAAESDLGKPGRPSPSLKFTIGSKPFFMVFIS